jgi:MerR family transcriptional regulator, light-induced transcriptional regulator
MYNDLVSFPAEGLRIGEFARRVGLSAAVLRAWERRYGLLEPVRSAGGFRLYTSEDAERVARMQQGLDQGLSAAQAARAARASARPSEGLLENAAERLLEAIHTYDETAVHEVLDESFAAFGLEAVLRQLILPALAEVGREWEQGTLAVSQEHFASNVVRARLLSLARLWGRGGRPVALLACAPGEQHDISLLAFGLVLRSHGWRIVFLGADTPIATLAHAAEGTRPALTVLASFDPTRLEVESAAIRRLARQVPLVLSGPGATEDLCKTLRVRRLDGDLITAAHETARSATT